METEIATPSADSAPPPDNAFIPTPGEQRSIDRELDTFSP
jgi:hypothetical protein